LNIMTFCAGGIVLLSTQKPGGKAPDTGGGAGAGGVGAGGVGAGGVGAGGVGAAGEVVGGVAVDTMDGGTPPDPHPNRNNPGTSKEEVATLAKVFISIPVVSGVNAENAIHTG
jgi:hypothetical protein